MNKKNVLSTQAQSTELDNSDECITCEAFIKVFDVFMSNNTVNIDEIDLKELCLEVDVQYKDQVNTSYILNDCGAEYMV